MREREGKRERDESPNEVAEMEFDVEGFDWLNVSKLEYNIIICLINIPFINYCGVWNKIDSVWKGYLALFLDLGLVKTYNG